MTLSADEAPSKNGRNTRVRGGRLQRTIKALLAMLLLGVALATLNVFTSRRDLALLSGPKGDAQREWLVQAADRPDIAQFFKKLSHEQRLTMAKAIGRYDDAPLAKLCGLLLADFDAAARERLVADLTGIAAVHPEAVAEQLKQKGSFQILGVSQALRAQGDRVLPAVVAMLANADARPAAVAYLVAAGTAATTSLLPRLDDPSVDVRLAAADALGGLRSREAVPPLLKCLASAKPAERLPYLTALAAIGDPSTERLLSDELTDSAAPLDERAAATLGLGRIGGPASTSLLWRYASDDEPLLANSAFSALAVIGAPALVQADVPFAQRVRLAASIDRPEADTIIRAGLKDPDVRRSAILSAKGRPGLLPDLAALLSSVRKDGDLASAIVDALASSPEGLARLAPYRADPLLAGFIQRAKP